MNVATFLAHHGLKCNPFDAEEARHDPVFESLSSSPTTHPDFAKILGRLNPPSAAVVLGEKGSGKTAIRLQIEHRVRAHNLQQTDQRVLLVAYDDLNPFLDRLLPTLKRRAGRRGVDLLKALQELRVEDHQDAILSLAVTRVVDALLAKGGKGSQEVPLPDDARHRVRKMPRRLRADLAVLVGLYDQAPGASPAARWGATLRALRLGWLTPRPWTLILATVLGLIGGGFALAAWARSQPTGGWAVGGGALLAAALALLAVWAWREIGLWLLERKVRRETPAVHRARGQIRRALARLRRADLTNQPWPLAGNHDSRYELTRRLLAFLAPLGYSGIMVLVDRVDEPTAVQGQADRMKALVWPMLDNKFLQQQGVGVKLLLPIELRALLMRESAEFFQQARLDKQHLIERLTWSGVSLYDLCTDRLRACYDRQPDGRDVTLAALFEHDVTPQSLAEALDQMHQPRDAFKFLYNVIQEHCQYVGEHEPQFLIPRLVLESVRRRQSQRLQDLRQGLVPA